VQPGSSEAEAVERFVREIVRPARIRVVPDYVTNLLGASRGGPGVVVVAGGGSVAYGRTADGREATAGGFGYLLGDEGGGFDIGRRAIAAAIHAHDGRGPWTELTQIVCKAFGVSDLADIKRIVYVPQIPRERIAGLVPAVVRAAEAEDGVARSILSGAGRDLGHLALAVTRRLFDSGKKVDVYPTGGVFAAGGYVNEPFGAELAVHCPLARIRPPQGSPLSGALLLAQELLAR
jgi:N-acetylglucosamine kinase-like BadF-type ATPase